MATRIFCLTLGLIYLALGILGFVPGAAGWAPDVSAHAAYLHYRSIGGIFPTNIVLNILYLLLGGAITFSALTYPTAVACAKAVTVLFALFSFMALVPWVDRLGGVLPLFSWNTLLYLLCALMAWYFGYIRPLSLAHFST